MIANLIIFAIVAELMWSFTSLIDKIVLSKGHIKNPFVYIVLNGGMNIFLVVLLPFFSFGHLKFADLIGVFAAGISLSLGVILYYKAVQCEEISRVLVLWQLIPIFVLVLSFLFLGERLTANNFIGFGMLLSAGFLISFKKINKKFGFSKAFFYMLGSAVLISSHYVVAKHIYSVTGFWSAFMWIRLASSSSVLVLLLPSVRKEFAQSFNKAPLKIKSLLGTKMLIDFSAFIVLGYSTVYGPISLISALGSSAAPIFIFIIASIFSIYFPKILKENIHIKNILAKVIAIALTIIGIMFINF